MRSCDQASRFMTRVSVALALRVRLHFLLHSDGSRQTKDMTFQNNVFYCAVAFHQRSGGRTGEERPSKGNSRSSPTTLRPSGGVMGRHRQRHLAISYSSRTTLVPGLARPPQTLTSSPRLSLHTPPPPVLAAPPFEASCGGPLNRLSSSRGGAVTSRYCNIKARRRACEDVRLPEPAGLGATSAIKAACERRIFPCARRRQQFLDLVLRKAPRPRRDAVQGLSS